MEKNRPITVTLICLLNLLAGSYGLVTSFGFINTDAYQTILSRVDLPPEVQIGFLYAQLATIVISAMFMMQEHNWARWLYIGGNAIFLLYNFVFEISPRILPYQVGVWLLFTILLVLPNANRYFSSKPDYEFDD
jgi:hypothetical protein